MTETSIHSSTHRGEFKNVVHTDGQRPILLRRQTALSRSSLHVEE